MVTFWIFSASRCLPVLPSMKFNISSVMIVDIAHDNPVNVAVNVDSAVAASCTAGAGPAHETNQDDEIHGEQLG
jgi:hypothetical protein